MRFGGEPMKFYNVRCLGILMGRRMSLRRFRSRSPYAGILFNHDSPLRPERFVTQKIVASAVRIAAGTQDKLYLGNIDIQRDWGWAEDYVEAMYLMLQQEESDDYVIATGESYKLAEFIEIAFGLVGLDWREDVGQ
jgi:GDPmannose 4,6-dehydratase